MTAIKAVLFDLDNTLYENDEVLETWARECAQRLISPEQSKELIHALPEVLVHLAAIKETERDPLDKQAYASILNRLVPGLTAPAIEFISAMYANWLADMRFTPDAALLLAALDTASIPYGVVTNAPTSQRIKTIRLGLESRAKCILISGEFGADKPDPAIFRAAAQCIGVPCEQILFVGDSPEHDVIGAHSAGMKAAWLRRGRGWPEELRAHHPDYVIDGLIEVEGIVCGS